MWLLKIYPDRVNAGNGVYTTRRQVKLYPGKNVPKWAPMIDSKPIAVYVERKRPVQWSDICVQLRAPWSTLATARQQNMDSLPWHLSISLSSRRVIFVTSSCHMMRSSVIWIIHNFDRRLKTGSQEGWTVCSIGSTARSGNRLFRASASHLWDQASLKGFICFNPLGIP